MLFLLEKRTKSQKYFDELFETSKYLEIYFLIILNIVNKYNNVTLVEDFSYNWNQFMYTNVVVEFFSPLKIILLINKLVN